MSDITAQVMPGPQIVQLKSTAIEPTTASEAWPVSDEIAVEYTHQAPPSANVYNIYKEQIVDSAVVTPLPVVAPLTSKLNIKNLAIAAATLYWFFGRRK